MSTNSEVLLTWTFMSKAEPKNEIISILTDGKKIEIYSLPYRSIDMWSSENAGKLFDLDSELELWTKAGHFKLKLSSKCDIREFDRILGNAILL